MMEGERGEGPRSGGSLPPGAPDVADAWIGRLIDGRYRIVRYLADGGMGVVFEAVHEALTRRVAVKIVRREVSLLTDAMERFRREAQAASSIGNPHIVDIYDFGVLDGGQAYFVMEMLRGVDLAELLEREGQLSSTRATSLVSQVADGMAAAHRAGIVHRDLKPENVLLVADPEDGTPASFVKLVDFGVAMLQTAAVRLTAAGRVVGTPAYMSPEQCLGSGVDERSDVYSLGVMLFELLTGRLPFDGEGTAEVVRKQVEVPAPAMRAVRPDLTIPADLEALVAECLDKDPKKRPSSMDEVSRRLRGQEADTALALPVVPAAAPPTRSTPRLAGALGALLLLAVTVMAGILLLPSWAEPELAVHTAASRDPSPPTEVPVAPAEITPEREAAPEAPAPTPAAASAPSTIEVATVPTARVWVEGEELGESPVEIPRPADGETVTVTVRRSGYTTRRLAIASDAQPSVRITLAPLAFSRPSRPSAATSSTSAATPERPAHANPAPARDGQSREVFLDPWD